METSWHTAIPIINREGEYVGTLTEGDLLWYIKNEHLLNLYDAEQEPVTEVPRHHDNSALPISTDIHDIFDLALIRTLYRWLMIGGIFIGIITRQNILRHCCNIDR